MIPAAAFLMYNQGKGRDLMYYPNYAPYPQSRNNAAEYQTGQSTQAVQGPTQPQSANFSMFFCRPVTSREEALSVPVDFMGNPMFFPDLAHGIIYMKRFNPNTGSPDWLEFRVSQPQQPQQQPEPEQVAFVPLEDFMDLKSDLEDLRNEIDRLKKPAGKAVRKNETADEQ